MERVTSVKSVLVEKQQQEEDGQSVSQSVSRFRRQSKWSNSSALLLTADTTRGPEIVKHVWSDEVDGAWAEGKAPVTLLTALLRHVEDEDVANAELVARESRRQTRLVLAVRAARISIGVGVATHTHYVFGFECAVLEVEPQNELVKDLLAAMKQQEAMGTLWKGKSGSIITVRLAKWLMQWLRHVWASCLLEETLESTSESEEDDESDKSEESNESQSDEDDDAASPPTDSEAKHQEAK